MVELLEKEAFYYWCNDHLIEPIHGAFFKEEQYQGYASHQEAVLAFLTYMNRVWSIGIPHLVPGLKEKLDQVPRVEVTLSPEVEARIEAGATAQAEADRKAEIKYLKDRKRHVDYEKLQKRFEESKQELTKIRTEVRKDREAALKEMPQLYELTNEVALVYTKDTSFEAYTGFPIRLNPEMMQGTEVASEGFFAENGEYELAFRSYLQVHRTKEDFWQANGLLFPNRKELVIYQWNTDFTNFYNGGREDDGAYLWSVYDTSNKIFTVIDINLIIP